MELENLDVAVLTTQGKKRGYSAWDFAKFVGDHNLNKQDCMNRVDE